MIVLIGERPRAPGDDPVLGHSGRRLAAILGLTLGEYAAEFERVHLVRDPSGPWPHTSAQREAAKLVRRFQGRHALLLGNRVARAFGVEARDPFVWFDLDGLQAARYPHPSGLSRWWNDPANAQEAARWLRRAVRQHG